MKRFLAVLLLCSASAVAQPIMRQAATTNSTPKLPNLLPANTNPLFPLSVLDPDGTGADRSFHFTPGFSLTGSNMTVPGNLSLNGRTNRLSIANDQLLLDGVAISGGESAPVNNFYATNQFFVSGKGNTLVVTQSVTLAGLDVAVVTINGTNLAPKLNFTNSASATFAISGTSNVTITASGSGGGSGVTTTVTPLAYSGTNITGFDCLTNNATYTLTLTNHCLFGTSTFSNVPNTTTNHFFTLALKQDSTGTWVPKFTNSIVAWADGIQAVIRTNANAVSYVYFHTHLFTNGMLVASPNIGVQ